MSRNLRDLNELRIARMALIKDRTRLRNRLQTLMLAFALKQAKARLTLVSRQLRAIDAEISACIARDDATAHKRAILRRVPGIGAVTAAAILIECPEVGTMTGKQIASLSGLLPALRLLFGRSTLMNVRWTFIRARLTPCRASPANGPAAPSFKVGANICATPSPCPPSSPPAATLTSKTNTRP